MDGQAVNVALSAFDQVLLMAQNIGYAVIILLIGWVVSKWVNGFVVGVTKRRNLDVALGRFLASIAQYTVLAAAVIASLDRVGIQTTSLVAVLASAGLAVGLALQGSLSNFASGVMILFFRPFQLGDIINAAGSEGGVEDIGLFCTTLVNLDNETIIIPNSAVTGGNIINYTKLGTRRVAIDAGVAYGEDLDKVQAVLLEAAASVDIVLADPEPVVACVEMAASSVNFVVLVWSKVDDFIPMQHEVRCAIYNKLNEAGIEIPFDQVVMHQAPTE